MNKLRLLGDKMSFGDLVESVSLAVILAVLFRMFIMETYYIPSPSMSPLLEPGNRIVVNKFNYFFHRPQRGDVVVFRYPLEPKTNYVKRVIGLPGETIQGTGTEILINGVPLAEAYLSPELARGEFDPLKIPEGHYFVMGDNRGDSNDSRYWGTLDGDLIKGKALIVFWPLSSWRLLD